MQIELDTAVIQAFQKTLPIDEYILEIGYLNKTQDLTGYPTYEEAEKAFNLNVNKPNSAIEYISINICYDIDHFMTIFSMQTL